MAHTGKVVLGDMKPPMVPSPVLVRLAKTDDDLQGILELQRRNHETQLSADEVAREGFVTARHDLPLLRRMHAAYPSVIATQEGRVVGYVLMMSVEFRRALPVLEPMFELFNVLKYQDRPLSTYRYYVNGQACVDKEFRGQRVLDQICAHHREVYSHQFDLMVTEIAARNTRSLRAHARIGFQTLHSYKDATSQETWEVVVWDWRSFSYGFGPAIPPSCGGGGGGGIPPSSNGGGGGGGGGGSSFPPSIGGGGGGGMPPSSSGGGGGGGGGCSFPPSIGGGGGGCSIPPSVKGGGGGGGGW